MKHVNFAPVCNTSTLIYEIQYLTAFIYYVCIPAPVFTCFICYNDVLQSDTVLYPHCDDIDHTKRRGDAPSDQGHQFPLLD